MLDLNRNHITKSCLHVTKARLKFLIPTILLLLFSCTDEGCIEADDFGEYESETIEVLANASQNHCEYDYAKGISDISAHGEGIKNCLISGKKKIIDTNGDIYEGKDTGCTDLSSEPIESLANLSLKTFCINECIQSCQANAGSYSLEAEPPWKSTSGKSSNTNSGITIRAGSEVVIKAVGNITLAGTYKYPDIYVQANNFVPHTKSQNWSDIIFDVRNGQMFDVNFKGKWRKESGSDRKDQLGTFITKSDDDKSYTFDERARNGARRLVAFIIEHPLGYRLDNTKQTETQKAVNVPLLPDARAWKCAYSGADVHQSECFNDDYSHSSYGYSEKTISQAGVNQVFPLTSEFESTTLTKYGGIIRWKDDGLKGADFDPAPEKHKKCVAGGSCNVTSDTIGMIGDALTSPVNITNNQDYANQILFKSFGSDITCNVQIKVSIKSSSASAADKLYDLTVKVSNEFWGAVNAEDKPIPLLLEPGQTLVIDKISQTYGSLNCGSVIAYRTLKVHDLKMQNSGFVSFSMLGGSGSCAVKGRVVNPSGSHKIDATLGLSSRQDFYEYGDAVNTLDDPLRSISVTSVWSDKVFLRKGQVLRFYPESWNGKWDAGMGIKRECGIGMAMVVDPRPALLCRGRRDEKPITPECIPEYKINGDDRYVIGCKPSTAKCRSVNLYPGSFCLAQECMKSVICPKDGIEATLFARTCEFALGGKIKGNTEDITAGKKNCTDPTGLQVVCPPCAFPKGSSDTQATCNVCSDTIKASAEQPAVTEVKDLDQCYDLEDYKGRVSNIPTEMGFTDQQLQNKDISKGAIRIKNFNGNYGNFNDFSLLDDHVTLKTLTPINIAQSGRLKFFVLDGNDFNFHNNSVYSNNSAPGSQYTEDANSGNGMRISFSSPLEFHNGEWMAVRLCKEGSSSSSDCRSLTPNIVDTKPGIIEINSPPSSFSPIPIFGPKTNYAFDDSGMMYRSSPPSDQIKGDCSSKNEGIATAIGNKFYCHPKGGGDEYDSLLRLSFKIFDPEVPEVAECKDGKVKITNLLYKEGPGNTGETCGDNESPSLTPEGDKITTCVKQFYCGSRYLNNGGSYYVNVRVKKLGDQRTAFLKKVIDPMMEIMDGSKKKGTVGQAERLYKLLISDLRYKAIVTMCMVVMVTFWGLTYLMGVAEVLTQQEIMNRTIKIGLIWLFVGETGWYWFDRIVVDFFKNGTDYLSFMMASSFDNSPDLIAAIAKKDYYDKSVLFSSVDRVLDLLFSSVVQKKISALLFASIFGWAYLIIIYWGILAYIYAVANAVLLYITAQMFISLLFIVGPIFFLFTLFTQTKGMFDNWLKQLIGFSLQQIFLLTTLAFFNMLMYEVIKMSLGYKICWDEVWVINIITPITLLEFWTVSSIPPRTNAHSKVGDIGSATGIPSLFTILYIFIIANLMEKFIAFMTDLAADIGGGVKASDLAKPMVEAGKAMRKAAENTTIGKFINEAPGKALDRIDSAFFGTGKEDSKKRQQQRGEALKDAGDKKTLADGATEAVDDYKKNNALEFSKMNEEEKQAKLKDVATKGMESAGAKLGLDKDQVNALKNKDVGAASASSTVGGALNQKLKEVWNAKGNPNKSLDSHIADLSKNTKEAKTEDLKKSMADMKPKDRREFVDKTTRDIIKRDVQKSKAGSAGSSQVSSGPASSATNKKSTKNIVSDKSVTKIAELMRKQEKLEKKEKGEKFDETVPMEEYKDRARARIEENEELSKEDGVEEKSTGGVGKGTGGGGPPSLPDEEESGDE